MVDWRTSVAREAEKILDPLGYKLDWLAFADAWRGEYQPGMEEVRSGRQAFAKLDVLHRAGLERLLPRFDLQNLSDEVLRRSDAGLAPARCLAGRAGGAGAAQAKILAGAGVERQHFADGRSRPPQQFSVGRDPRRRNCARLQAQAGRLSRRLRGVRSQARAMHDGGRAQQRSRRRGETGIAHRAHRAGRTNTARTPARPRRRCRSISRRRIWPTWRTSSARNLSPDTPAPAARRIPPGCDRPSCSSSAGSWRARCRPSPRTACPDWAAWRRTSANPPSTRCRPIARA